MSDARNNDVITIYADYVCPFCYLGRQSLAQYQATRDEPLEIEWHPFDLRSQKRRPDGSIDHSIDDGKGDAYFEQAKQNVRRLADNYGVEMTVEIATDIDSLPAQIVSFYVQEEYPDRWSAFDDAIYDSLWQDARDIGDPDVLTELATDVGLNEEDIREALGDDVLRERIQSKFSSAQRQRITGVPTFVYGEYAARGAVSPEHLERLVEGT